MIIRKSEAMAVKKLGESIGYGNLMELASALWRKDLKDQRSSGIKTGYWSPNKKEELVCRLAEYEDTGLTPQEIYSLKASTIMKVIRGEWIPVDERLPENPDELVLVQVSGRTAKNLELIDYFQIANYVPKEGWILEMYPYWEDAHPVAWMTLPEPFMISRRQQEFSDVGFCELK